MANTNPVQTWDFNSALHNSAAKADYYDSGPVTGADLLANDPGSASFIGLYDATTGKFLLGDGVHAQSTTIDLSGFLNSTDSIYEVIRLANGTFSSAAVYHNGGSWLDDFTGGSAPLQNGWAGLSLSAPDGWTSLNGTPSEIVGPGYINFAGAYSGNNWLDTQASTGGIDIQTTVPTSVAAGGASAVHDILSITLSPEQLQSVGLQTQADAKLDLSFNGQLVHEFTLADFTNPVTQQVNWNTMVQFKFDVADNNSGHATIELHDVTPANFVGFAVDSVGLHSYIV